MRPLSEFPLAARKAIRAIGYVPHAGARSLRSGRSNLIGLVVPSLRILYDYAWFVGFGVSAVLYLLLARRPAR